MSGTGAKKDLFANEATASGLSNQYSSQALGIGSKLTPQLTAESVNPQGYSPTTMGQMTTAAEQTAGGSNAGVTGEAGLRAARTRNIGAGQAATAEGGRAAGQELSQVNAGIQSNNAKLKAQQQQEGLSGLEQMYGTDVNAGNNALGLSNQAIGEISNVKPSFGEWLTKNQIDTGDQMAVKVAGNSPKCWLTTACTQYAGLPDDCEQLTVLRKFRDGYLSKVDDGDMIRDYYAFAPLIVDSVNRSDRKDETYLSILRMVNSCVQFIRKGKPSKALKAYSQCYIRLKQEFCS